VPSLLDRTHKAPVIERPVTAAVVAVVCLALGLVAGGSWSRYRTTTAVLDSASSNKGGTLTVASAQEKPYTMPDGAYSQAQAQAKSRAEGDADARPGAWAWEAQGAESDKIYTYTTAAWTFSPTRTPSPTTRPTMAPTSSNWFCKSYDTYSQCADQCVDGRLSGYTVWCTQNENLVGTWGNMRSVIVWDCNCLKKSGGCFSEDAEVSTPHGPKTMRDLRGGDEVLAVSGDGKLFYDHVVTFGHHEDTRGNVPFTQLSLAGVGAESRPQQPLVASPDHFVPTFTNPDQPWASATMKRARDVRRGDLVAVVRGGNASGEQDLARALVTDVTTTLARGLYDPITMSGTVVVDGVVASVHSEWFLDAVAPEALVPYLPAAYQAVLWPVRALFRVFGPEMARIVHDKLDVPALILGKVGSPCGNSGEVIDQSPV
jgi:hypothetical protein